MASGQRRPVPRRRVYELLLQGGGPVKAYDLMEVYSDVRTAKPPTVYRALEHLEQIGLVHRIASLNAYVACGADEGEHAPAFLICDCCGSAQEFEPQGKAADEIAALYTWLCKVVDMPTRGRVRKAA